MVCRYKRSRRYTHHILTNWFAAKWQFGAMILCPRSLHVWKQLMGYWHQFRPPPAPHDQAHARQMLLTPSSSQFLPLIARE